MRRFLALPVLALLAATPALAAPDAAQGAKLVAEKKCEACHEAKVAPGKGAIYQRKDRKVTSLDKLRSRVAMCNSELDLQLFPEDEAHIVEYLNKTYYKFGK